MRLKTTHALTLAATFVAGLAASPLLQNLLPPAHAQAAPLAPAVIDLMAINHGDLPATPNADLNARGLVITDNATIGVQSGNVGKHMHAKTDEIQYIIEGSGSMWLGGERREFKPGTLLIIPRGTAHAGSIVTSGPVKALAIKIPPQPKDDTIFVE